jgi:uncharacterized protein (DUF1499 family)
MASSKDGFVDFKTLVRSSRPNAALLAPPGLCETSETDKDAPVFDVSPEALWQRLVESVEHTSHWKTTAKDDAGMRLKFVAVTPFMRFRDDVDAQVLSAAGGGSTIAIYSRSRVGYSDLGKNLKRVEAIVDSLRAK